jgi:hypothetical protein
MFAGQASGVITTVWHVAPASAGPADSSSA